DGRVTARERDVHFADVVGMVREHALLVEELAFDAVRVALHVERAAAEVGEGAVGDFEVVADDVALRQAGLGEEHLVGVRDRDVLPADSHALGSDCAARPLFLLLALVLAPAALAAKCPTVSSGKLIVGTDTPAYPPWFGGKPPSGSPWKVSD